MQSSPIPQELASLPRQDVLAVAATAAKQAGDLIMTYFDQDIVSIGKPGEDAPYNLVTRADIEAEKLVASVILATFPDHHLLGEEALRASTAAEHLWVIDPIDGTNNFAHGVPHFAVSIAYYQNGEPVCGVVFNPARGDWYWSRSGSGSFYNGRRMQVSRETGLEETLVGCGFYYDRGAMMRATLATIEAVFNHKIHGIRRMGTAALDFCAVASGQYGAYFEYYLNAWDFAAARLFVTEAGGMVTTGRGEPLPLAPSSVLVTNGKLHAAMLEILKDHHPPDSAARAHGVD